MKRRSFLQAVGGTVGSGSLGVGAIAAGQAPAVAKPCEQAVDLPKRVVGRTGLEASIVGFPGLALIHGDQQACTKTLQNAFEQGVNYFDVAPAYGNGDAEIKMGTGLEGIPRCDYHLACKTKKREKAGAREELERSLDRLKTDHFDVYQLHALRTPEEVKKALGEGGALETLIQARKEGKVRFVGFSAHTMKAALTAMKLFRFDTVMFPVNFVEYFTFDFAKPVLELAGTCDSIFRKEEEKASGTASHDTPLYPESPHECCPCRYA